MSEPPPLSGPGWTQDPKSVTIPPVLSSVDGWTEKGARAAGWYADSDNKPATASVTDNYIAAAKAIIGPGAVSTIIGAAQTGVKTGEQATNWLGRVGIDGLTFAAGAGVAALGFYLFATRGV